MLDYVFYSTKLILEDINHYAASLKSVILRVGRAVTIAIGNFIKSN